MTDWEAFLEVLRLFGLAIPMAVKLVLWRVCLWEMTTQEHLELQKELVGVWMKAKSIQWWMNRGRR